MKEKLKRLLPAAIILAFSCLMLLPYICSKGIIMGGDAIFHYNRFYDTAMQIKTGHFNYFTTFFGFQQSGRVVNAVYGPLFAYFQGFLVLISGSWRHYQILSDLVLYLFAGGSMYLLLRTNRLKKTLALPLAGLFITTYAIQYWTLSQGFTSWGTSLMPLALIPLSKIVRDKQLPVWSTALVLALMTQIHVLSTIMLVLLYIPFVATALYHGKVGRLFKQIGQALLIYLGLTANIWYAMFTLYRHNDILPPFINGNMSQDSINTAAWYWLVMPVVLIILGLTAIWPLIRHWRQLSLYNHLIWLTALVFLLLSTNLLPWDHFIQQKMFFAELIQFPFRFFAPFTVLLIIGYGQLLKEVPNFERIGPYFLTFLTLLGLLQTSASTSQSLQSFYHKDWQAQHVTHSYVLNSNQAIRQSMASPQLLDLLTNLQKSTPDYLPVDQPTKASKYNTYAREIVFSHQKVTKKVTPNGLLISWFARDDRPVQLPVVLYHDSQLSLPASKQKLVKPLALSSIGQPTVVSRPGHNQLLLHYHSTLPMPWLLAFVGLIWLVALSQLLRYRLMMKRQLQQPIYGKQGTNRQN
ncbi:hypothetical protein [Lapidilactobacillus wuchangensis]|uniref:hypothetical protein n=1 Tax=Lapidilactobacillus wuchangensis TaxID=2486001 RepID=UPI000F7A4BCB|nr:hypothetical protein [Lapidilactobacillus wuchangensis]